MEHSPTPWKIGNYAGFPGDEDDALIDATGECAIYFADGIDEEFRKLLLHILLCVNAHDALVAALRAFMEIGCASCPQIKHPDLDCRAKTCLHLYEEMVGGAQELALAALAQLEDE